MGVGWLSYYERTDACRGGLKYSMTKAMTKVVTFSSLFLLHTLCLVLFPFFFQLCFILTTYETHTKNIKRGSKVGVFYFISIFIAAFAMEDITQGRFGIS